MSFIKEFYQFLKVRKKYWLLPIFIVFFLLGSLMYYGSGSVMAPFVYSLF